MPTNDNDRLVRQVRSCGAEFRARDEGGPVIEGYFSVFNRDYELWPGAVEQVAPGAFRETLGGDIRALANHDTRLVLGRTTTGTLTLREDDKGLFGTIKMNEQDSDAMNLYARVQRGDVSQCSFGFDILDEEFTERSDGSVLWTIRKVKLYEVSVVTFPAYVETAVSARKAEVDTIRRRKLDAWKNEMKERMKKWH
nr:MAG TPA: prohead serine protease [Caudoviricetes sp.]